MNSRGFILESSADMSVNFLIISEPAEDDLRRISCRGCLTMIEILHRYICKVSYNRRAAEDELRRISCRGCLM